MHDFEDGWLFPQTALYFVMADKFAPGFLWPFVLRGRDGSTPDVVVAGGFRLSRSSRRCQAARCRRCGGITMRYGLLPPAL